MPIKHEYWECSLCHESYKSEEEALGCENKHVHIKSVVPDYYDRYGKSIYPESVKVTFEDGTTKVYGGD